MARMVPIILYLTTSTEWKVLNIFRALKLLLGKSEVSWRELLYLVVLNMTVCLQAPDGTKLIRSSSTRT